MTILAVRVFSFFFAFLAWFSCSKLQQDEVVFNGKTMGTTYKIKFISKQKINNQKLENEIEEFLTHFNKIFSTYDPKSEISQINDSSNKEKGISITSEFQAGIEQAIFFSEFTGGKFNPSILPLVDLWGFGVNKHKLVPRKERVNQTKRFVDYKKIKLKDQKIYLEKNMRIDLSAIAKGRAVDLIGEILEKRRIENYLVEIGGEIRVRGYNKNDKEWGILIVSPDQGSSQEGALLLHLNNKAIATSGDYQNYFEKDGKRYSHIVDPITGYPVEHKLASVSVVAETCEKADALATALLVMGELEGRKFALKHSLSAYFIYRDQNKFSTFTTSDFAKIIKKN